MYPTKGKIATASIEYEDCPFQKKWPHRTPAAIGIVPMFSAQFPMATLSVATAPQIKMAMISQTIQRITVTWTTRSVILTPSR
jgi:hypothetical protein